MDKEERVGWEEIGRILSGEPRETSQLFEPEHNLPQWVTVDVTQVQVERLRRFGDVFLALAVWKRLKLDTIFEKLSLRGREEIGWDLVACILSIARLCEPSSDLAVAERWYAKTAMDDLLGVSVDKINDDRLYRALDKILPYREKVCEGLQKRYTDWFGTKFDFLLYDITSVYFEGLAERNEQAKRGYSRDKRPDCAQVCIGLVVTMEGLPVGYEVFDGNRGDVTTLEDIVDLMEGKYGKARRVWVFDRGVVSEDNIELLRERGAKYVVGTPKTMLKQFEAELTKKKWVEVQPGVEVKMVAHPDHGTERFILCRSQKRKEKERGILQRQVERLEKKLEQIQQSIYKGKLRSPAVAERRIGRWLGRYSRAEKLLDTRVVVKNGRVIDMVITRRDEYEQWSQLAHGAYLLRTNLEEEDPKLLWKMYIQLNQVEQAFRVSKSDLGIRPIFHQKKERVQAHIFICFLALAMWKSLELWMSSKGLGTCARRLIEEMKEIRSLDVVLPVQGRNPIRLRVVGKPEKHVQVLLHMLGLRLPNRPKMIKNVVQNFDTKPQNNAFRGPF
jgi:transposase